MLRLMAWQSTPISMLSRVIPENTTKTANSQNRGTLSCQHVVCATLRMCLCVCVRASVRNTNARSSLMTRKAKASSSASLRSSRSLHRIAVWSLGIRHAMREPGHCQSQVSMHAKIHPCYRSVSSRWMLPSCRESIDEIILAKSCFASASTLFQ